MSELAVVTESLLVASSVVGASGVGAAGAGVGSAEAALLTPAGGAWGEFVGRADRALACQGAVVEDLSRGLRVAAVAYEMSERSVTGSLRVDG